MVANRRGVAARRPEPSPEPDPALVGHRAILAFLADCGIPTTRRALHRWMQREHRPIPVRRVVVHKRLQLAGDPVRIRVWIVRMSEEHYVGFTKIRLSQERRSNLTVPLGEVPPPPGAARGAGTAAESVSPLGPPRRGIVPQGR